MNASRTVTVASGNLTVGGVISGSGYSLTKAGTGTLVITSDNAYSGPTSIRAGTLQLTTSASVTPMVHLAMDGTVGMAVPAGAGAILDSSGNGNMEP